MRLRWIAQPNAAAGRVHASHLDGGCAAL